MPTGEAVPFHLWCFSGRFLINIQIRIRKANSSFVSVGRKGSPGYDFWSVSFWVLRTSLLGPGFSCGFSLLLSRVWLEQLQIFTEFRVGSSFVCCTALALRQETGENRPHPWHWPAFRQTQQNKAFTNHCISNAFFFFLESAAAVVLRLAEFLWGFGT